MDIVIHGLTEFLFFDIILIWAFVSMCILAIFMMFGTLFIDNGLLSINNKNIIGKIIKLKNDDLHLSKFARKLDSDNIYFLSQYKMFYFDRLILSPKFNEKVKPSFINNNEKRLYEKIDGILYYYDLIKKNHKI